MSIVDSQYNDAIEFDLGGRPPFFQFPDVKENDIPVISFIDGGDCLVNEDDYELMCKAFFLWRHQLSIDSDGTHMAEWKFTCHTSHSD